MQRWIFALVLTVLAAIANAATPLPTDSIYRLPVTLTNQNGAQEMLAARRGQAQVVSMFYTACDMVCPMIIDTMHLTARAVAADGGAAPALLAISFDPERDDVAALRDYAARRQLNLQQWTLARVAPADVRRVSALLGIAWRAQGDGHFNHTSKLVLLDREGRITATTDTIGRVDPAFVAAVRAAVGEGPDAAALPARDKMR